MILIKVSFKRKRPKPKNITAILDWNLCLGDETKVQFNTDLKDSLKNHVYMNESKDISFESFSKLLISSAKKV